MNLHLLILHLSGSVALLLWAVRMVRTGVERGHEPALRRSLRQSKGGRLRAAGMGTALAVVLQSSTAVALLAAGFASSGIITVGTGIALMLGADLGSSIVVRLLSFDLRVLAPALLIAGGLLFFKGRSRATRQHGRILIGIALVLVSLRMIGEATAPLREASYLPAVVGYLRGDFLTAFLLGAAFTWLVHSSVASVLLVGTFAANGIVPFELGVCLVLGANLGGGFIAFGLTRHSSPEARRIALGNLLFRGLGACVGLLALRYFPASFAWLGDEEGARIVNLHVAFNLLLVLACLPFADLMAKGCRSLIRPMPAQPDALGAAAPASCLDESVVDRPTLALASATRELLRMAGLIERMLTPLMELYETGDPQGIKQARELEELIDKSQTDIKLYLSKIRYGAPEEIRSGQELASFAINLEYAGDAISDTLLKLAETRRDRNLRFSDEGWREIAGLHHSVMANMRLALNVLVSKDRASARQLVAEKDAMRAAERASYRRHLHRLQKGTEQSIETSNLHLETIRSLKTINSLFASVAYPILSETGDLLESRLNAEAAGAKREDFLDVMPDVEPGETDRML